MKKVFMGSLALVIAIGMVAFTKPPKNNKAVTDYIFQFDIANYSPTEANVEDPSKWLLAADETGCTPVEQQKACKIRVHEDDTEVVLTVRRLKSGTVINALEYMSTNVFRPITSTDVLQAYNRAN